MNRQAATSSKFQVGHRVVVREFSSDPPIYRAWLVGHYGHVRELVREFVVVDIKGPTTETVYQPALDFEHGWAFYPEELEHAD